MDPRTSYLSPKYFKIYKNNYGNILENYYFSYLRTWNSENVGTYVTYIFIFMLELLIFWKLKS